MSENEKLEWDYFTTILHLKYQINIPSVMNHDILLLLLLLRQHYSIEYEHHRAVSAATMFFVCARDISCAVLSMSSSLSNLSALLNMHTMQQKRSLGDFQQSWFCFLFVYLPSLCMHTWNHLTCMWPLSALLLRRLITHYMAGTYKMSDHYHLSGSQLGKLRDGRPQINDSLNLWICSA